MKLLKVQCGKCGHVQGMRKSPGYKCYGCGNWTHDESDRSFRNFKPGDWVVRICKCGYEQRMTRPQSYQCTGCKRNTFNIANEQTIVKPTTVKTNIIQKEKETIVGTIVYETEPKENQNSEDKDAPSYAILNP